MRTLNLKDSTNIQTATLGDDGVLSVVFNGGKSARYGNFTEARAAEWEAAPSSGSWFHQNVKTQAKTYPVLKDDPKTTTDKPTLTADTPITESNATADFKNDPNLTPDAAAQDAVSTRDERLAETGAAQASTPQPDMTTGKTATGLPGLPPPRAGRGKVVESEQSASTLALAQALYSAYTQNSDNLNYEGKQCPTWDGLTTAVRSHWCATAIEARALARIGTATGTGEKPWKVRAENEARNQRVQAGVRGLTTPKE